MNTEIKERKRKRMIDYLFMDAETEECFIVQEYTLEAATEIAQTFYDDPIFLRELTEDEAEDLGFDTF